MRANRHDWVPVSMMVPLKESRLRDVLGKASRTYGMSAKTISRLLTPPKFTPRSSACWRRIVSATSSQASNAALSAQTLPATPSPVCRFIMVRAAQKPACAFVSGSTSWRKKPRFPSILISHAADLSAASSVLTHEDERRWRVFRQRVEQVTARTAP